MEDDLKVFGLSTVKSELNIVIVNWPLVFWYHWIQPTTVGSQLIEPSSAEIHRYWRVTVLCHFI